MHDPAEINRLMSASIQSAAEAKLGRALTEKEGFCIWNHGSFMGLEMIDRAIYFAKSPADVEEYLAQLPEREPLPEEYTRRD